MPLCPVLARARPTTSHTCTQTLHHRSPCFRMFTTPGDQLERCEAQRRHLAGMDNQIVHVQLQKLRLYSASFNGDTVLRRLREARLRELRGRALREREAAAVQYGTLHQLSPADALVGPHLEPLPTSAAGMLSGRLQVLVAASADLHGCGPIARQVGFTAGRGLLARVIRVLHRR